MAILEASEGDARKYMKKAIEANGLSGKLTELYGPNWSEAAFKKMRDLFVHHGCDVYFVPGLARIAYGELHTGNLLWATMGRMNGVSISCANWWRSSRPPTRTSSAVTWNISLRYSKALRRE